MLAQTSPRDWPPISCNARRPRIFLYPPKLPPFQTLDDWRWPHLRKLIRALGHASPGHCADYFFMSNQVPKSTASTVEMFSGLAQKWPWWNLTLGRRRHLLLSPCDHGPGDCMYSRQLYLKPCSPAVPKEINPKHPQRELVFLMASGAPQHWTFFRRGLDVRLPQDHAHECGPFCGISGRGQGAADPRKESFRAHAAIVRRNSPWAMVERGEAAAATAALRRQRTLRFFFAGKCTGARAHELRAHAARPRWLIHDTKGAEVFNRSRAVGAAAGIDVDTDPEWFVKAMASSDFCFSPLGQTQGDSDRYLPAVLYGCVPVFPLPGEALPFEDVLDWNETAVRLTAEQIPRMHEVLDAIPHAQLVRMRRRMREIYRPLLWSSAHGSYLGEPSGTDATSDAFATLMASLRKRLPAGSGSRWCATEDGCASSPAPPPTKDPLCDLDAARGPLAKRALG